MIQVSYTFVNHNLIKAELHCMWCNFRIEFFLVGKRQVSWDTRM